MCACSSPPHSRDMSYTLARTRNEKVCALAGLVATQQLAAHAGNPRPHARHVVGVKPCRLRASNTALGWPWHRAMGFRTSATKVSSSASAWLLSC
jgi:hypothetical protein